MSNAMLDSEELITLALHDIGSGSHDKAIEKLKQAASLSPDDARIRFLLGAEHAEIGLRGRAMEGMEEALRLDPNLHPARLQLGLLQLMANQVELARETWSGLGTLGPDDSMVMFTSALLCLSEEKREMGEGLLREAILREVNNPALKHEMERILRNLESSAPLDSVKATAGTEELLSKYGSSFSDDIGKRKH